MATVFFSLGSTFIGPQSSRLRSSATDADLYQKWDPMWNLGQRTVANGLSSDNRCSAAAGTTRCLIFLFVRPRPRPPPPPPTACTFWEDSKLCTPGSWRHWALASIVPYSLHNLKKTPKPTIPSSWVRRVLDGLGTKGSRLNLVVSGFRTLLIRDLGLHGLWVLNERT